MPDRLKKWPILATVSETCLPAKGIPEGCGIFFVHSRHTNDKMYFCKGFDIENAKTLYNDFINARDSGDSSQARLKFQKICSVMKERVNDHYISPINTFLNATRSHEHREWYGFIVMGINCILIEFYYEMIYGYDQSNDGGAVLTAYKTVLPQLENEIIERRKRPLLLSMTKSLNRMVRIICAIQKHCLKL